MILRKGNHSIVCKDGWKKLETMGIQVNLYSIRHGDNVMRK